MPIDNKNSVLATCLPSDLRKLVGPSTLLSMTYEAVTESETSPLNLIRDRFSNPMLLTLTTYGYACGIYSSQQLENAVLRDPKLRYICANHFPRWQDIRRFRRSNRNRIEQALSQMLGRVFFGYVLPRSPDLAGLIPQLDEHSRVEAKSRIDHAIIIDGVDADL